MPGTGLSFEGGGFYLQVSERSRSVVSLPARREEELLASPAC
jgi:hypothetical protein